MPVRLLAVAGSAVLAAGLLAAGTAQPASAPTAVAAPSTVPTSPVPSSEPVMAAAPASPAATAAPPPTPPPPVVASPTPRPRTAYRTSFSPYATAGPVVLHLPVDVVEVVGLHESGHDGAQQQAPVVRGLPVVPLESRGRDTGGAGAADIVADPALEVRAPVTGTVLRAGTYTLYCDHVDEFLVVEPDAAPGWEVKLLHFSGLRVAPGDRVEAGVTVVGAGARPLPFRSQVDDETAAPHWPHLHVEVVDPSVVDRPTGGGCD